jgi:hypothetical protein
MTQHQTAEEYRLFWLSTSPSAVSCHHQHHHRGTPATDILSLLLRLDAEAAAAVSSPCAPPSSLSSLPTTTVASTISADSVLDDDLGSGASVSQPVSGSQWLSTIRFVAMFCAFDAASDAFRALVDLWTMAVSTRSATPAALAVADLFSELQPALMLSNMTDPYWNYAEMACGASAKPFALSLLRTLLATRADWDLGKLAGDVARQIASAQSSRAVVLESLMFVRVLLGYCPRPDAARVVAEAALDACVRRVMPGVCGVVMEETVAALEKELMSPGSTFRSQLLTECPWLISSTATPSSSSPSPPLFPLLLYERKNVDAERIAAMVAFWKPR